MSKVKMPEPVAFRWKAPIVDSDGRQCGESEWKIGMEKGGLPWWTQDNLITTTQAEAYADARVREELEAIGGHRLVEPDHETAMALADAPRSLRNYVDALRSAIAMQTHPIAPAARELALWAYGEVGADPELTPRLAQLLQHFGISDSPDTIRSLRAERDALREALEVMVEMVEMNGFGRAYAMNVARAALAQGQGGGDDA